MRTLLERLEDGEILISDGAMGTFLQARGLKPGECPEEWCISHPEVVKSIAEAYIEAGADIVETNSFGGSDYKLNNFGMADRASEFAVAAARLAREAMGNRGYVAASVGPTGHFLEPLGDATPERLERAFLAQIVGLSEGGADAVCIETMSALDETETAIHVARENTNLTVIATMTFEKGARGFRTMMGVSPTQAAKALPTYGAQIIGANCGNGIANMVEIVKEMRAAAPDVPILVHANAGMPILEDGATVFKETPEDMAARVKDLVAAGAGIIGGCCGTTPDHIRAMAAAIR